MADFRTMSLETYRGFATPDPALSLTSDGRNYMLMREGMEIFSRPAPQDPSDGRACGGLMAELFAASIDADPQYIETVMALAQKANLPDLSMRVGNANWDQRHNIKGYDGGTWFSVVTRAGTPPAIVDALNQEIITALATQDLKERFTAIGFDIRTSTPNEFARFIRDDMARVAKVIKSSGIKAE